MATKESKWTWKKVGDPRPARDSKRRFGAAVETQGVGLKHVCWLGKEKEKNTEKRSGAWPECGGGAKDLGWASRKSQGARAGRKRKKTVKKQLLRGQHLRNQKDFTGSKLVGGE